MAKIKIIIRGVAMSYHKGDGIWKVIFPFGDGHEVRFRKSGDDEEIVLAKSGRQIRIETINPISSFGEGDNYKDFLDLTDKDYSHAQGVKLKAGGENKSVCMSIRDANFSVDEHTQNRHMLSKNGEITFAPKKIGYSGKLEIEAEKVMINIDDDPGFQKSYDTDSTIIFDNDCHKDHDREESDFKMLYKVVESVIEDEGQFVAAKVKDKVDAKLIEDPNFWGDLPCHKVRISQPVGLP